MATPPARPSSTIDQIGLFTAPATPIRGCRRRPAHLVGLLIRHAAVFERVYLR